MRMIPVKDVQLDMILGKSIYGFNNKLLLGAGFRMTPDIKTKLLEKGYTHVYVMEDGTEEVVPEDIISEEIRLQARTRMAEKEEQIQNYFKFQDVSRSKIVDLLNKGYMKDININYEMKKVVDEIVKDISAAGSRFMNSLMFKSDDTYLMDHSINTTVLSILIGQRYRFSKSELSDLALGAYLHDFGKIIINKMRENNGNAADELMHEHPTFGYLMVRNSQDSSPIVSQIINQHHENQDGSGYPIGLKGENLPPISTIKRETKGVIFRLAEIISVADRYDNLLMKSHNGEAISPAEAIKLIVQDAGRVYNKDIVQTLTKVVPTYPVGTFVKIEHIVDASLIGYTGVVAKINEHQLNKPIIILLYDRSQRKIAPRKIDTSKLKHVELKLLL